MTDKAILNISPLPGLKNEMFCNLIRIFIGSSPRNYVEERVLVSTLRRCTSSPLRIYVINGDEGIIKEESDPTAPMPLESELSLKRKTHFSLGRFTIPKFCHFSGRAIYLDSDQIVLGDIFELWNLDLGDAAVAAVPVQKAKIGGRKSGVLLKELRSRGRDYFLSSVMLMDCFRLMEWDLKTIAQNMGNGSLSYFELMGLGSSFREQFRFKVKELSHVWNHLDTLRPDSNIIHFTDLSSQPWRSHHHRFSSVWEKFYLEAIHNGFLDQKEIKGSVKKGFSTKRIAYLPRLHSSSRPLINGLWKIIGILSGHWKRIRRVKFITVLSKVLSLDDLFLNKLFTIPEKKILGEYCFLLREKVSYLKRVKVLLQFIWLKYFSRELTSKEHELTAIIFSRTCIRMLFPILYSLLQNANPPFKINLLILTTVGQEMIDELASLTYSIHKDYFVLIKACMHPEGKVVLSCLDQQPHRHGYEAVRRLRSFSVKTVSIQHGGTRDDSIRDLSTAASDLILVWNMETYERLTCELNMSPKRLRIVGHPQHDKLQFFFNRDVSMNRLKRAFPSLQRNLFVKKIVLLATCLHSEYGVDRQKYIEYMKHIYKNIDFESTTLIVKMHPLDSTEDNLYTISIPPEIKDWKNILVIEPNDWQLDFYSLLPIADVVITRASTTGEEALLFNKKVIAFDLDPSGPSSKYRHLQRNTNYKLVYRYPTNALKEAIREALSSSLSTEIQIDKNELGNGKTNREKARRIILEELFG